MTLVQQRVDRWGEAPVRLAPAAHAFRTDDRMIIHAGGDDFIVPELPAVQLTELTAVLCGSVRPADCVAFEPQALADILDELVSDGIVLIPGDGGDQPPATVAVLGATSLADVVGGLLGAAGVHTIGDPRGPAEPADVVVACADWLPDRHWCRLDAMLAATGTAWHRCHGDGRSFYLGPFTVPGVSAGHVDTRRRQLAATDAPDLLLDLWAHLDGPGGARPFPWPDAGVLAAVAGTLAADVLAYLRGEPTVASRYQVELRCDTMTWTRHPVLPVPGAQLPGEQR